MYVALGSGNQGVGVILVESCDSSAFVATPAILQRQAFAATAGTGIFCAGVSYIERDKLNKLKESDHETADCIAIAVVGGLGGRVR
jgi:hypothetical protein